MAKGKDTKRKSLGSTRYQAIIQDIFFKHWKEDLNEFEFEREELNETAQKLGLKAVKNLGDISYTFRYREVFPVSILDTQPEGKEWVITGAGKSRYRFKLVKKTRIQPSESLIKIAVPDATPEMIRGYALDDEQALLAIIRYNRLIDTFLGLTTYSMQNHLRTTVEGIGQIEIDELYVGLDKYGCHYVIPVQAKGGKDQIGIVQISQDLAMAAEKFPGLKCRAIAAQFMKEGVALFELTLQDEDIKIIEEKHYKLVPASQLDQEAIRNYRLK